MRRLAASLRRLVAPLRRLVAPLCPRVAPLCPRVASLCPRVVLPAVGPRLGSPRVLRSRGGTAVAAALAAVLALTVALPAGAQSGAQSGAADGTLGAADPLPTRQPGSWLEVVLEGGVAMPLGDLGAGFANTDHGMGADLGHALGVCTRFYVLPTLAVAPSFTYVEFGAHEGLDATGKDFEIQPTVLRYGLDVCWVAPGERDQVRPLAGLGFAVLRNRYRDEVPDDETFFEAAANDLALSLRAGLKWNDFELSLQYEINRFRTGRFTADLMARDHDWDHVVVRLGYVLPRS